jgi:RNA polymerase sigma factor (sigma-70 family)
MNVPITKGRCGRRGLPKPEKDAIIADYLRLRSHEKVAALHGRTRQSIWDVVKRAGYSKPPKRKSDVVIWNGLRFTEGKNGYLRRTNHDQPGERQLHRLMWIHAHGPIPEGHNVMFLDGNRRNCTLENLACLPIAEVSKRTATGENATTKQRAAELVASVDRWISKCAHEWARKNGGDVEELIQVGRISAYKHARTYREESGRFMTYAARGIKRVIWQHAARMSMAVHVPSNLLHENLVHCHSIDAPLGAEGETTWGEINLVAPVQDEHAGTAEEHEAVMDALEALPEKEGFILRARFFEHKTLQEISASFRVSKERIRQLETKALQMMRKMPQLKKLKLAA